MTSLRHSAVLAAPDGVPSFQSRAGTGPDAYLDAARSCILDLGWRRTTLTEVARRAGVSRMTIYRTWPDMPTLLGDLMTREWSAVMAAQTEPEHEPGPDRLVTVITGAVRALRANELFVRIVEVDPELILPYLFARRGRSQDLVLQLITDELAATDPEALRRVRPDLLARSVLLTLHGFVLSAHTMADDSVSLRELDDELIHILHRILRR